MKRLAHPARLCQSPACRRALPWWRRTYCGPDCARTHAEICKRRKPAGGA